MRPTVRMSRAKERRALLALIFALAVCAASARAQSLFSNLQSAAILKPRQVELTPDVSMVFIHAASIDYILTGNIWNSLGLQLGVGITDRVELRFRYGYVHNVGGTDTSAINVGAKIGLWKDKLSLYVPVEVRFGEFVDVSQSWNVQPTLMASFPVARWLEINPATKVFIRFHEGYETLFAVNLGLGIFPRKSRNLVIRPEASVLWHPGDSWYYLALGLGFSYRFGR